MARKPRDKTAPEYQQKYDKLAQAHRRMKQRHAAFHRKIAAMRTSGKMSRSKMPELRGRIVQVEKELEILTPKLKEALEGQKVLVKINKEQRRTIERKTKGIERLQKALSAAEEEIARLRYDLKISQNSRL